MKFIQMLLAALLLVFVGSTFGYDVLIYNPDLGDAVNHKTFTVVGKALNYAEGEQLTVQVMVTDEYGDYKSTVYPQGTVNSDRIEIIMPKPSTVSYSPHKFPIVAKITGFSASEKLYITLKVTDAEGRYAKDLIFVTTK